MALSTLIHDSVFIGKHFDSVIVFGLVKQDEKYDLICKIGEKDWQPITFDLINGSAENIETAITAACAIEPNAYDCLFQMQGWVIESECAMYYHEEEGTPVPKPDTMWKDCNFETPDGFTECAF